MLKSLQIRNFAIIDQVDVEFDAGMTVLTGETGAGKSILVDALGLVLGERGGNGLVRSGAKRAEFSAEFRLADMSDAKTWLDAQSLDQDEECVLRRVINADGRSRAYINGNTVSLQTLKTFAEQLLDIHGQHFHQSLGRREVQRELLDYFGDTVDQRRETELAYAEWQSLAKQLNDHEVADADRASRMDLLDFQLGELDALDFRADEMDALQAERLKLHNSSRLADGVSGILQNIFDSDTANAQSILADACQMLERLTAIDAQLAPVLAALEEANIQVSEATDSLRRYAETIDMNPERRDWIEERLNAIQTVARKHRVDAGELPQIHDRIRRQSSELQNAEEHRAELAEQTSRAAGGYRRNANRLSAARREAAARFSSAVSETMTGLGMPGGMFQASVVECARGDEKSHGIDRIEFLISANPGQEPMSLATVASGGELSRMSLAIQVIASNASRIQTMVFDEIDSGIGGGVAEMVGRRLHQVAEDRQVLCVTHLAQVASLADHHYRINKITDGKSTRTGITRLGNDERIEELARMLGGVAITKTTREHAAEMLKSGLRKNDGRKVTA
jgi:DNA repair protein RecN (Recombination protein N)